MTRTILSKIGITLLALYVSISFYGATRQLMTGAWLNGCPSHVEGKP
jgi:hypothetical protein